MTDLLGKLFGSSARVKVLRLFILNPDEVFEPRDVRMRSQISPVILNGELPRLAHIGLIRHKVAHKNSGRKRNGRVRKRKIKGWILNPRFLYLEQLKSLIINKKAFERNALALRFRNAGRIKLLILAGIFLQRDDSRVDVLIVGDYLKKSVIGRALKTLESEIGKDLKYGVLNTKEFMYRFDIYDRFIRDVLDYPHEKVINKINLR